MMYDYIEREELVDILDNIRLDLEWYMRDGSVDPELDRIIEYIEEMIDEHCHYRC
jgi:hypothetical protein